MNLNFALLISTRSFTDSKIAEKKAQVPKDLENCKHKKWRCKVRPLVHLLNLSKQNASLQRRSKRRQCMLMRGVGRASSSVQASRQAGSAIRRLAKPSQGREEGGERRKEKCLR